LAVLAVNHERLVRGLRRQGAHRRRGPPLFELLNLLGRPVRLEAARHGSGAARASLALGHEHALLVVVVLHQLLLVLRMMYNMIRDELLLLREEAARATLSRCVPRLALPVLLLHQAPLLLKLREHIRQGLSGGSGFLGRAL
jgi:hypothetical protein